jgi:UDP-N-acetylmuramoylalanine-D-glutamate ligase
MLTPASSVAILGFGRRAATFAALLAPRGCALRAWDPLLATTQGAALRARIEAAGVDAMHELAAALRGARLVVVDTAPRDVLAQMPPQAGQQRLDLGDTPPAQIDTALIALGLPPAAADWATACAATAMSDSTAMTTDTPAVPRGELP